MDSSPVKEVWEISSNENDLNYLHFPAVWSYFALFIFLWISIHGGKEACVIVQIQNIFDTGPTLFLYFFPMSGVFTNFYNFIQFKANGIELTKRKNKPPQ